MYLGEVGTNLTSLYNILIRLSEDLETTKKELMVTREILKIGIDAFGFFTISISDRKSDRRSARQKNSGKINLLKNCLQWNFDLPTATITALKSDA